MVVMQARRMMASIALLSTVGAGALAAQSAGSASGTMKAVRVHGSGGIEALQYEDAPRPVANAGDLLVRVMAAGVNPVDVSTRRGGFGSSKDGSPTVPGFDVAGVVEAVGAGVTAFRAGDAVYAMLDLQRPGAYADYVIVRAAEAALKPRSLSFAQAAGVPLVALTAYQAFFDTAGLQAGQTVLIQGGSGGVGSYAIQLAKSAGARVIAVASERNQAYMRQLGADVTVDYGRQRFEDVARDVDVVLDTVGGETARRSIAVVRPGGHYVAIIGMLPADLAAARGVKATRILVRANGAQLATVGRMFDDRRVVPAEHVEFPLAKVRDAHQQIETGHTRGKVVLIP